MTPGRPVRMPSVFLSHGAPPLADDETWTHELAAWSDDLPRPEAVLVVSAHWESAPLTVSATETVPLFYDFFGFPHRYYEVTYPAPGAPDLADLRRKAHRGPGSPIHQDLTRGLDHGAYVPLVEMYPAADVPVLQVSMPTLDPSELFDIGRSLAPLRHEGALILGSGFSTHNLREMNVARPLKTLRAIRIGPPRPDRPAHIGTDGRLFRIGVGSRSRGCRPVRGWLRSRSCRRRR